MISLSRVTKSFGTGDTRTLALDDVSIDVPRGTIFGVVGQSGAGKSTLIRTVNLLERPDSGTVTIDGRDVTALPEAEFALRGHLVADLSVESFHREGDVATILLEVLTVEER